MAQKHAEIALVANTWSDPVDLGWNAHRLKVTFVSAVGNDKLEISFDRNTTTHGVLGPLGDRPLVDEFVVEDGPSVISFRCASNAVVGYRAVQ